jgi:hypothetical protein
MSVAMIGSKLCCAWTSTVVSGPIWTATPIPWLTSIFVNDWVGRVWLSTAPVPVVLATLQAAAMSPTAMDTMVARLSASCRPGRNLVVS